MKKVWLLALIAAVLSAPAASAIPVRIRDMSSTTLPSAYTHTDGILSLNGVRPLTINYVDDSSQVLDDVTFTMSTSLADSSSMGGIAYGLFLGGSLSLTDTGDNELLLGNILQIEVIESVDGSGVLVAHGSFSVSGGSLLPEWQLDYGSIFDLIFEVDPITFDDFATQSFTALSDITLKPVPEPLTLSLLAIGLAGLGLAGRRRA